MIVDLPYGNSRRPVRMPEGVQVDFLTPKPITPIDDVEAAFHRVCSEPIDSPPPDVLFDRQADIAVLVSDLTRGGGTKRILPICIRYLKGLGIAPSRIKVIVARGTHRKLTREEKQFFKGYDFAGVAVEEHNCDDNTKMCALVLTSRGTPVRVNRILKEAGHTILLGSVSFHYFAGFGGGRKLILPGCSDRASILANHRLSLLDSSPVTLNPLCQPASLEKNPIQEDMCEALAALKGVFAINFFGDTSGRVAFINAGSPLPSHAEACEAYTSTHLIFVDEPYRIVVLSTGGDPYDINLLQSHKALRFASSVVEKGGAVLFLAECGEGIGSEGLEAAFDIPRKSFLKGAYKHYRENYQTAVSMIGLTEKFRVGMVTKLSADTLKKFGVEPCDNIESFLAGALEQLGGSRIAVIPYGNSTLPKPRRGGIQ